MSAPVTTWTEQPDIAPDLAYDDSTTVYDSTTVFYDDFDPTSYDPRPLAWTDET